MTTYKGLPSLEYLDSFADQHDGKHVMCVLDDISYELLRNEEYYKLFTQKSHHKRCTFIVTFHTIFNKAKSARLFGQNCHYLILTRNLRDMSALSHLARQVFPGKGKELVKCYQSAMENSLDPGNAMPKSLLIAFHPFHSSRDFMIFSDFLPAKVPKVLYRIE